MARGLSAVRATPLLPRTGERIAAVPALDPAIVRRARAVATRGETDVDEHGKRVARAAGLRYVHDTEKGITRRRKGSTFAYYRANGGRITEPSEVKRINSLAIPPAYRDVWICRSSNGHIQATGRDARGRKQYRYHPRWQAIRDAAKYERMLEFGEALPRIRRRVARLMRQDGLPRSKVLATLVQLLEATLIRIGNEEYARENRSYGLTTLCTRHVELSGATVHFNFRGKSGIEHTVTLKHPRVAKIIKLCAELPGLELFQYLDDEGNRHAITSSDVNAFLHEISGKDFTAKDFRTWAASVAAMTQLVALRAAEGSGTKKHVLATIKAVAERLGNTPAICRKSYIHPALLERYTAGTLPDLTAEQCRSLRPDEALFLAFLRFLRQPSAMTKAARSTYRKTNGKVKPQRRTLAAQVVAAMH